jgi:hypothetical protein
MPEFAAGLMHRDVVEEWGRERCEELCDLLEDALRRTGF